MTSRYRLVDVTRRLRVMTNLNWELGNIDKNIPRATGLIAPPALREDRASVRGRADNILIEV